MITYAQNYEDVLLARVFAGKTDGFYVDVGAADPVDLSVTKWFYDSGWSGLNIEPNRALFDRLVSGRPRDINVNCGVGAKMSEAQYFEHDDGALSSFDPDVHEKAEQSGAGGSLRTVTVVPLADLLAQHCPGRVIDFLKIDVEGWEAEVLEGLDLATYRPIVLLIEATLPGTRIESHAAWEPTVLAAGYSFVYFDGLNRFYVADEHSELKSHFSVPLNSFDQFETAPQAQAKIDAEQRLNAMNTLEGFIRDRDALLQQKDDLIAQLNCQFGIILNGRVWKWALPKWLAGTRTKGS